MAKEKGLVWNTGAKVLKSARQRGTWPDGKRVGHGYPQPYLQAKYADMMAALAKTVEGRPGGGWLE